MGHMGEGRERYRFQVMEGRSHENKRHSVGSIVGAIAVMLYGDRW